MALSDDELIIRVRAMGFSETEAQAAALRREIIGVGDASVTAGERSRTGFGLLSRGIGGLAAAVGFTGAIVGIKDLIKQGMSLQMQQGQLRNALANMGITGEAAFKRVDDAAIHMAEHGGFTRPEQLTVMTRFIAQTHNLNEAMEANKAATELARGAQIPWQAAQMAVGRALAGNTTRLAQYVNFIPQLKTQQAQLTEQHTLYLENLKRQYSLYGKVGEAQYQQIAAQKRMEWSQQQGAQVADKQATALEVLNAIHQKYGGSINSFNHTIQGMASNLKNSFQIMVAQTGESLLPAVRAVLKVFVALFDFLNKHREILVGFAAIVGAVAGAAGLKLMYSGLRMVAVAAKESITTFFGLKTRLIEQRLATQQAVEQDRLLVGAIERLDGITPQARTNLLNMSQAEIEAAGSAEKMNQQIEAQVALAAEWQTRMETAAAGVSGSMSAATGATQAMTGAMVEEETQMGILEVMSGTLALAMDAIPGVIIFTAIGVALGALMTHWKEVEAALVTGWHEIEHWANVAWGAIETGARAALRVIDDMLAPVRWLVHAFETLFGTGGQQFHRMRVATMAQHGRAGARHSFPGRAGGGPIEHFAWGGSVGTDTVPAMLSPGEYVLNSAVAQQIGLPALNAMNAGSYGGVGGNVTIQPGPVVLNLDGRTIARGVVRYTVERAARGPSSLVGGSIVTGSGGPTSPGD